MSTAAATTTPLDDGTGRLSRSAWAALLVLCGALFLDAMDVSMTGVALPSIRTDLDVLHELAAVGRQRLRARLRRLSPARRARRGPARPPASLPHLARSVRRRVRAGRAGERRDAADRNSFHQGRQRGLHGARRPLDHHDQLRRGRNPQQGACDLQRDRRDRVLARAGVQRAADRTRLAVGVPLPGAAGADHAPGRDPPGSRLRPHDAQDRQLRPGRGDRRNGWDVALGVHGGRGARGGMGFGAHARLARRRRGDPRRLRRARAADTGSARPLGHSALRFAGTSQHRRDVPDRRLVRVPVHRDAVHAAVARVVGARDRPGALPGRRCSWLCSRPGSRRWSRASASRR